MTPGHTQTSVPPRPVIRSLPQRERMSVGSIKRSPEKQKQKRWIDSISVNDMIGNTCLSHYNKAITAFFSLTFLSSSPHYRRMNFRLHPGRKFGLWSTSSPLFKCSNTRSTPGFSWRVIRETSSGDYNRSVVTCGIPSLVIGLPCLIRLRKVATLSSRKLYFYFLVLSSTR